jgi:hypothetical protein
VRIRLLLVVALVLAATGGIAASRTTGEAPLMVAAGGSGRAPERTEGSIARDPAPATASTAAPTIVRSPRSTSSIPTPSSTTISTTMPQVPVAADYDWRAQGLPGPPGSTIYPWTEAPYDRSDRGLRATIATHATADGAVPGSSMTLTVTATWTQYDIAGAIELIGPMDPTKPYEQQPTQILDSWATDTCNVIFGTGVSRTVTVELPMQKLVKPDFTMNNLEFEVRAMRAPCDDSSIWHPDAWVHLSFNVNEPYVVVAPSTQWPPLARTG